MTPRLSFSLAALVGVLALPARAGATPTFPTTIQTDLQLSYVPDCSLCHQGGVTTLGTVVTPFGLAMRAQNLEPNDVASLNAALLALSAAGTDSDGDGVGDIDELIAGTDPNGDGSGPRYGCAAPAEIAGSRSPGGAIAAALVAVALAVIARRRR